MSSRTPVNQPRQGTLHLLKLCVGCSSIDELADWQAHRLATARREKRLPRIEHRTFQQPKRSEDLLAGGSLYWVMKGLITARQRLLGFDVGAKDDGTPCSVLVLDPELVAVRPTPRRAFQGWRYLQLGDAPPDLSASASEAQRELPPEMRRELAALGLI